VSAYQRRGSGEGMKAECPFKFTIVHNQNDLIWQP